MSHDGIDFPLLDVVRVFAHFIVELFLVVTYSFDRSITKKLMVAIHGFLFLSVTAKPPSLTIDGMAPFVVVPIVLAG